MEETAEKLQRLLDGELVRELRLLQLDADAMAKLAGMRAPVQAEQLHGAAVGAGQSFANFNRSSFAGAIGAKQSEALGACHVEVEAIDSHHLSVGLAQAAQQQRLRACLRLLWGCVRACLCQYVSHSLRVCRNPLRLSICIFRPARK